MTTDSEERQEGSGAGEPRRPPTGDPSGGPGSGGAGAGDESGRGGDSRSRTGEGARGDAGAGGDGADEDTAGGRRPLGDGIRQSLGVLSAFRDALEETIQEARDRGELSTDRAREMMQQALHRAREAAGEARGKLDFAPQHELDALRSEVEELRGRVHALEARRDVSGTGSGGKAEEGVSRGGEGPPSP